MNGLALISLIALLCFSACTYSQDEEREPPDPDRIRQAMNDLAGKASGTVVYTNLTLVNLEEQTNRTGMSIVVDAEHISKVGPTADIEPPGDAEVVNGSGWFAIPGLIDAHVHLATLPDRKIASMYLKRHLYSGITTVRDMAGDARALADLSRAALINEIESPDIHYAAILAGPGFFSDPRTQTSGLGVTPGQVPWMQAITAETDLKLAVAQAKGTSATGIKIYANLTGDLVRSIIAEARSQAIPVWTHQAVFPATPFDSVESGATSVSHACMIAGYVLQPDRDAYTRDNTPDFTLIDLDDPVYARYVRAMKSHGTVLDATLSIYPAANSEDSKPGRCPLELAGRLTRMARDGGVRVAAGTDAWTDADDPFPVLFREIELLVEYAGFAPAEAIGAATMGSAAALGMANSLGTLEPGKLANIVFLREDPSKDVAALKSAELTIKRGLQFPRNQYRHESIPALPFPDM